MQSDYTTLAQLLHDNGVENSLAEIHGLITGLLCTGNEEADPEDIGQLFQPPQNIADSIRKFFLQLAAASTEQLQSLEYDFHPVLPPDDSTLAERVESLAAWCDGFTVGFAAAYFESEAKLGPEIREILADFAQFAGMADSSDALTEQDELDYMELVEYVRMAVIMVYQQLNDSNAEDAPKEDVVPDAKFLH